MFNVRVQLSCVSILSIFLDFGIQLAFIDLYCIAIQFVQLVIYSVYVLT